MKKRILLVDDEVSILKVTHTVLEKAGYEVVSCYYPEEAIYRLENEVFDLMITDLKLNHRLDGLDLVREAQRLRRNMPTIIITAYATVNIAVKAMKEGINDFITKPFKMDEFLNAVSNIIKKQYELNNSSVDENRSFEMHFGNLVGDSEQFNAVYSRIENIPNNNTPILICGEKGSGKNAIAQALASRFLSGKEKIFELDCVDINHTIESNSKKGVAFASMVTDPVALRTYLTKRASKSIVFFDNISKMSSEMQETLLAMFKNAQKNPLQFNIIAMTTQSLEYQVHQGEFNAELFALLNANVINVPALRHRVRDIPLLINYFISQISTISGLKFDLTHDAKLALLKYSWPGNVAELKNVLHCASSICDDNLITILNLPPNVIGFKDIENLISQESDWMQSALNGDTLKTYMRRKERQFLEIVLEKNGGNRIKAAQILGISRASLYRKLEEID